MFNFNLGHISIYVNITLDIISFSHLRLFFFFFQAEDGIRDIGVTGVQTCALPISVLTAAVAAFLVGRTLPTGSYQAAAGRGLGGGGAAGVVLTLAASIAGGAVGPGRMGAVGIGFGETLVAAVGSLAIGGLPGGRPAARGGPRP